MALEHAILGFLGREPMTGYDLKTRCFDAAVGHLWTADQAQVYRTLDRLAARHLVKVHVVTQRGKPDRRVFSITAKGRAALAEWLRQPEIPGPLRDPLLLHLSLASGLEDREISDLLGSARDAYQARLGQLRSEVLATPPSCAAPTPRDAELRLMTLTAAIASARTTIDWIDDCMERVEGGLPPSTRTRESGAHR
jgi:PadR family transcriptional regulator, regulatory protein AphA